MTSVKTDLAIVGGEIYTPTYQSKGNIVVRDGKIESINTPDFDEPIRSIDATGCKVIPGLIDGLVHGGGGCDTMTGHPEDIEQIARAHANHGVTSLVLGISSATLEEINRSLEAIGHVVDNPVEGGSRILGSYVEGKFGSSAKCGAQNPDYMSPPNFEEFHDMWAASDGTIKVISIAPENDAGLNFTKHLATYGAEAYNGIVVAMGHTNATYAQAMEAIDAGITRATHTYNGMSGLHQRDLGVVEAIYSHPGVHAELIVDGQHVKPIWGQTLIKWKGVEGVGLITDCDAFAGVPEAEWKADSIYEKTLDAYRLNHEGSKRYIRDGALWLNLGEPDEKLYGAMITLMDGLRNVVNWGYTLEEAVTMATITPARNLGVDNRKGSIAPGKDADLVILDATLDVQTVIVEGSIVKNEKCI